MRGNRRDGAGQYSTAVTTAIQDLKGTARLLSGYRMLQDGSKAGVSAAQFQSIFPDLASFPTSKVEGFIEISAGLASGEINIPRTAFRQNKELEEDSK